MWDVGCGIWVRLCRRKPFDNHRDFGLGGSLLPSRLIHRSDLSTPLAIVPVTTDQPSPAITSLCLSAKGRRLLVHTGDFASLLFCNRGESLPCFMAPLTSQGARTLQGYTPLHLETEPWFSCSLRCKVMAPPSKCFSIVVLRFGVLVKP